MQNALGKLDPSVANILTTIDDTELHLQLLIDFLSAAEQNRALSPTRPMTIALNKASVLSLESQRKLLQNKLYKFMPLSDREICLCFSSHSRNLSEKDIDISSNNVMTYFPQLNGLLGGLFSGPWLHLQIYEDGALNITEGVNIRLTVGSTNSVSALVHELCHTYNSKWTPSTPIFITEGIPELFAYLLTGTVAYDQPAARNRVSLQAKPRTSAEYVSESVNGFRFFRDVLSVIGVDNLTLAISEAYATGYAGQDSVLRFIRKHAGDSSALDEVFGRWLTP